MVEINVQKLVDVELPTRGSREAAGRDVKALEDAVINPERFTYSEQALPWRYRRGILEEYIHGRECLQKEV